MPWFLPSFATPILQFLFGVSTSSLPLRIIMQFYSKRLTLAQELVSSRHMIHDSTAWLLLCSQLMEAMLYLHTQIEIIHSDIKCNSILLADSPSIASSSSSHDGLPLQYHVVLIDLGKATECTRGRHYSLSEIEVTYLTHPHIAPEVTYGERPQSTSSDIKFCDPLQEKGPFTRISRIAVWAW